MRDVNHLLLLLFLLLHPSSLASSLSTTPKATHHHCLYHQRSSLLQLQENLLEYSFTTHSYSKADLWDLKTDCCSWLGVACNGDGLVTQLYLSGPDCPMLKLENPILELVFQNLSFLVQIILADVDLSAQSSSWCEAISPLLPNLRVLTLNNCALSGPICSSLFILPSLELLEYWERLTLDWALAEDFFVGCSGLDLILKNWAWLGRIEVLEGDDASFEQLVEAIREAADWDETKTENLLTEKVLT
ncbi:unnamed protein product [Dovyalis caffra]|uniref:Leucine-rich repeat-containing N-terminal plant-type domain-containing protein n=1 Tax=Dovyalis caffra TaxID=77055 RepID=A0AAV1QSA8_9ROSI|nr:unnamed protein product [Dovyalis caffra]